MRMHVSPKGARRKGGGFFRGKELPEPWTIGFDESPLRVEIDAARTGGDFSRAGGELGVDHGERGRGEKAEGGEKESKRLKVLNLFAYTGGSTLAAAAAGMEVTHVDAAKNIVEWARRNAELSGMADAPIRWICEDAWKFVKREIKRGNRYDAVILDPPSYGHGPKGEVWQLAKHLPMLLAQCAELTAGQCQFLLLTCHTPGYDAERLSDMLKSCFPLDSADSINAKPLFLQTADGREMPSGAVVRCGTGVERG